VTGSNRLLLRIRRRNTATEVGVEDVIRAEFSSSDGSPDLMPSVYDIPDDHSSVVRIYCEHHVGLGLEPPVKSRAHWNLRGLELSPPINTPGTTGFSFADAVHHEVPLPGHAELQELVARLMAETLHRERKVEKEEAHAYIRERVEAGDPEWASVASAPAWARKLAPPKPAKK
jgi:hypothetical protein